LRLWLTRAAAVPLLVIGAYVAVVSASEQVQTGPSPADGQSADQPPKPPPLFPRHGRGIYRNASGNQVIDASPQSPPLVTDDPAVPDDGQYEINLSARVDHTDVEQHFDLLNVDANYGVRLRMAGVHLPSQIKVEVPLSALRAAGAPVSIGLGVAAAGLKVNFYDDERRGLSLSFYPQLEFPTPGGRGVKKGIADPGKTLVLPLLVAKEFHEFTMVFNGALETPLQAPTRHATTELGAALGRALTRKDALMMELRTDSSVNLRTDRLVLVNAGYIHGVRHIVAYGSIGRSVFADDDRSHVYAGIGIKVQIDTRRHAPR
jgi:hypothetical protein